MLFCTAQEARDRGLLGFCRCGCSEGEHPGGGACLHANPARHPWRCDLFEFDYWQGEGHDHYRPWPEPFRVDNAEEFRAWQAELHRTISEVADVLTPARRQQLVSGPLEHRFDCRQVCLNCGISMAGAMDEPAGSGAVCMTVRCVRCGGQPIYRVEIHDWACMSCGHLETTQQRWERARGYLAQPPTLFRIAGDPPVHPPVPMIYGGRRMSETAVQAMERGALTINEARRLLLDDSRAVAEHDLRRAQAAAFQDYMRVAFGNIGWPDHPDERAPSKAAQEKATALLLGHLTERQKTQWQHHRRFQWTSPKSKTCYHFGGAFVVTCSARGVFKAWCVGPETYYRAADMIPDADRVLAQYLFARSDEQAFKETANPVRFDPESMAPTEHNDCDCPDTAEEAEQQASNVLPPPLMDRIIRMIGGRRRGRGGRQQRERRSENP